MVGPGIVQQDLKIFKELGMISQVRGLDSAGIYQVKSNLYSRGQHNFEGMYKTNGTFNDLLDDLDMTKNTQLLNSVQVDVIMGHVRHATRGSCTRDNAHPFVHRGIVGMHNGTLRDEKFRHATKTDSELMFTAMAWQGIPEVLSSIDRDSAYVVTIYDKDDKALYFAKNPKRTFHFAMLKNRSVLYWASEKLILQLALKRNAVEAEYFAIKDYALYRLYPKRVDCRNTEKMFTITDEFAPPPVVTTHVVNTQLAITQQGPATPIPVIIKDVAKELEVKAKEDKEPKKEQSSAVLPFVRPRQKDEKKVKQNQYAKGDTRQFHLFCKCGKDSLNLYEAFECKRGAAGYPKYDPETDKFECQVC